MTYVLQSNFPHRLFYTTLGCFILLCMFIFFSPNSISGPPHSLNAKSEEFKLKNKVPVELFVMSKCPGNSIN